MMETSEVSSIKDQGPDVEPGDTKTVDITEDGIDEVGEAASGLKRQLNNRHIQLLAIGGSIGVCMKCIQSFQLSRLPYTICMH